ncbi:MAG: CRISPR system precrRNA processing endoribonuclease RAMP protein Cas6 [Bacteroidetes bacterium]|nr:CRISPR system precrRNA processing endoribonuclease RAMP protein Cas6 [Bacteroidota bacterium]
MKEFQNVEKLASYKKFSAIYDVLAHLYVCRYQFVIEAQDHTNFMFLPDTIRDSLLYNLSLQPINIKGKKTNVFDALQNGLFIDDKNLQTAQNKDRKGYTLSYLHLNQKSAEPGTRIVFFLTLCGNYNKYINQWIAAAKAMCNNGLGNEKARFTITNISEINQFGEHIANLNVTNFKKDKSNTICFKNFLHYTAQAEWLNIRFLSPVNFGENQLSAGISFKEMITKTLIRFLDLAAFYCRADISKYTKANEMTNEFCADTRLHLLQQNTQWKYISFESGKDIRTICGCTGNIIWKGRYNRYLPLLKMGEILQAGQNTTYGCGNYRVIE